VLGDRVQLQQVVLNLVIERIEAMAEVSDRSRELSVRRSVTTRRWPRLCFVSVQDAGPGLAPEHLDRVFEAFLYDESERVGHGVSPSARSIMEAHGGRLWVNRQRRPRLTFQFVLPAPNTAPS